MCSIFSTQLFTLQSLSFQTSSLYSFSLQEYFFSQVFFPAEHISTTILFQSRILPSIFTWTVFPPVNISYFSGTNVVSMNSIIPRRTCYSANISLVEYFPIWSTISTTYLSFRFSFPQPPSVLLFIVFSL